MTKLWFKAKKYGYGWYPASKEGWIATAAFVVLLLFPLPLLGLIGLASVSAELFTVLYLPYTVLLVIILLWISVKKGEKARWRWGGE
jgi:hypothetical protein